MRAMYYKKYMARKILISIILVILIIIVMLYSLSYGAYPLSIQEVLSALIGKGNSNAMLIVWNIRLPRIVAGIVVGAILSVSGAIMQGFLRNPLATPFTMGVSHGAMFGASLAIFMGIGYTEGVGEAYINNPYAVIIFAFAGALVAIGVVLSLAKIRNLSPSAIILAGVAMSFLFTSLVIFIQYFANELQLAAMVYWSFGDLGRATWLEDGIMVFLFVPVFLYFIAKSWDLNASSLGDEIAKSVGIEVEKVRLVSLFLAALITAVSVAFVGIIGFIGLIAPHTMRLVAGGNYRFLMPLSALFGIFLVVASDTIARLALAPMVLPVGVITSFLGAPTFIYLLLKMGGRE